jgi:undecaprenyl-diphosphatase
MADVRGAIRATWGVVRRVRGADRVQITVLLAILASVAGSWAFIALADEVIEGESHAIDVRILEALREPDDLATLRGPPWIEEAARDLTALGGVPVLAMFTVAAVTYLWLRRLRAYALLAAGAVAGGALLFSLLKALFGRPRPTVVPMLVEEGAPSFPSGHATLSAVVYLSVAVLLARFEPSPRLRFYLLGVGLFVTVVVGLTRVLLGVHYPTDVLAGWSLGLAWAAVCWLVALRLHVRSSERAPLEAEDRA